MTDVFVTTLGCLLVLVVLVVLGAVLGQRQWWSEVECGKSSNPFPDPAYFVGEDYLVQLDASGDRPIEVLKVVREVTDLSFREAQSIVNETPVAPSPRR